MTITRVHSDRIVRTVGAECRKTLPETLESEGGLLSGKDDGSGKSQFYVGREFEAYLYPMDERLRRNTVRATYYSFGSLYELLAIQLTEKKLRAHGPQPTQYAR